MKRVFLFFSLSLLLLFVAGCTTVSSESSEAIVSVFIVEGSSEGPTTVQSQGVTIATYDKLQRDSFDLWADVEKLEVHISGFSYMVSTGPNESNWATPTNTDKTVDLMTLSSTDIEWFSFDVPKDTVIVGIAFRIDEATATVGGVEYPVNIREERKTVTAQNLNWEIGDSGRIELQLDLTKSVIKFADSYFFAPRFSWQWRGGLRNLWAIHGDIKLLSSSTESAPTEPLLIALYTGESTDTTPTIVKMVPVIKEGEFYLGKYDPGKYTVVVWDDISITVDISSTDVTFSTFAREATHKTFDHGKTNAETVLHLTYRN
ncbi:MAG TPA: hypothetical protein PKI14_13135 [Fervidobacterium sp.]|nr:hypothetical protein [Fervidobacterium sp.]HPT54810.1 hypothetical protein [Fervidobacterium sp.]HPZ18457.1 hypothetical protein [Fervidobacterium sp.]HUM43884.1 hypothetical protein [Fervidobacterium sp.]